MLPFRVASRQTMARPSGNVRSSGRVSQQVAMAKGAAWREGAPGGDRRVPLRATLPLRPSRPAGTPAPSCGHCPTGGPSPATAGMATRAPPAPTTPTRRSPRVTPTSGSLSHTIRENQLHSNEFRRKPTPRKRKYEHQPPCLGWPNRVRPGRRLSDQAAPHLPRLFQLGTATRWPTLSPTPPPVSGLTSSPTTGGPGTPRPLLNARATPSNPSNGKTKRCAYTL